MPNCKYCGTNTNAGGFCLKSPSKGHVVDTGPKRCIYCGMTGNVGSPCIKSPTKGHVMGEGK